MTKLSRRVAAVAAVPAAALTLSLVAAMPAAAAVTCGAVLSTAISSSLDADGYTITRDLTYQDMNTDEWVNRSTTASWDNVHHRMMAVPDPDQYPGVIDLHMYADAHSVWEPLTYSKRDYYAAAFDLLGKPDAAFVRRHDISMADMDYWEITNALSSALNLTSVSTNPDGTMTVICTGIIGVDSVTTTVAPSGLITGIVEEFTNPGMRFVTSVEYSTPVITFPSSTTVEFAELVKAIDAVLLPGRIRALAESIVARSYKVAKARHHRRPTYSDIRRAAIVKTKAFNKAIGSARLTKAHVVLKPRGARVYGIAPLTGKRTSYTIHRVGRQVRI